MRNLGLFFVVTAAAVGLTGCGQIGFTGSSARGGLAVVDLDKVAAETGRDQHLAQSLELRQNSLNQFYAKNVESAKEQLNAKKKTYGEELSDENKMEFSALERNAIGQLSQLQNQARADFENFKQKQIAQFRAELKPIAQEVAAKRGLSVVIPKNEGLLLSVDSGVDITDDVVKVLRVRHPQPARAADPVAPADPASKPEPESTAVKASNPKKTASSAKSAGSARTANAEDGQEKNR